MFKYIYFFLDDTSQISLRDSNINKNEPYFPEQVIDNSYDMAEFLNTKSEDSAFFNYEGKLFDYIDYSILYG